MTRIAQVSSSLRVVSEAGSLRQRLGAYRLLVDGTERSRLRGGEQVVVELLPGRHVVQVRRAGRRGGELAITTEPGEVTTLALDGLDLVRLQEPES